MGAIGNVFNVPHFISSESPEGLRARMLENNIKDQKEYQYYSIVYDGSNFIAFYYKMSEESVLIKKVKK